MKLPKIAFLAAMVGSLLASCSNNNTQIGENTFVHGNKIYKVIDNELREIGDLNAGDIKKFEPLKPVQLDFGTTSLSYIKPGATTTLKALYRGNYLYYSLSILNFPDLSENTPGSITIQFIDEYGFILHSTEVPTNELVKILDGDGKLQNYVYNGKTEMSIDIKSAIKTYSLNTRIRALR